MKKYIEKEKAVGIAYGYCHTTDGRCCGPDDVVELYEELKAIQAADVVPWEWLERYADYFCAGVSIPEFVRKAKMVFYKEINGGTNNERK